MSKDYEADERALEAERERVLAALAAVRPESRIAQLQLQLSSANNMIETLKKDRDDALEALRVAADSAKALGARYIRLRSGVLRMIASLDATMTEMAVVLGASGE